MHLDNCVGVQIYTMTGHLWFQPETVTLIHCFEHYLLATPEWQSFIYQLKL